MLFIDYIITILSRPQALALSRVTFVTVENTHGTVCLFHGCFCYIGMFNMADLNSIYKKIYLRAALSPSFKAAAIVSIKRTLATVI